jgi:hypothetical protein
MTNNTISWPATEISVGDKLVLGSSSYLVTSVSCDPWGYVQVGIAGRVRPLRFRQFANVQIERV